MRRYCFFFIILWVINCFQPLAAIPIDGDKENKYPEFLSISAIIFLEALSKEMDICEINSKSRPSEALQENFPIVLKDSIYCINGFVEISDEFNLKGFSRIGVNFAHCGHTLSTICIPLQNLCEFLKLKGIIRFDISRPVCMQMDEARDAINANKIVKKPGKRKAKYTGKGVILGFVDYGFDYTHPDFYTTDKKKTRISRVWEQGRSGDNAPKPFHYGRQLLTPEEILAAGTDTQRETHGTHVAAIATGNGNSTKYYGLAYDAELVFVSTTRTDAGIADGLQYIAQYAKSVGKPCVINFSLGSQTGPHDGTSAFDRLCEKYAREGLIFTGSVGNNGNRAIYLETVPPNSSNDTIVKSAMKMNKTSNQMIADMWAEPDEDFFAHIEILDDQTGKIIEKSEPINAQQKQLKTTTFNLGKTDLIIQMASEINPYNKKANILAQLDFFSPEERYIPILVLTHKTKKPIRCWLSDGVFTNLGKGKPFQAGSYNSTLGEIGGTGKAIISAGAYCTKNEWKDLTGEPYTYGPKATIGQIGDFSAKGPTADGRTKPDITCPGYGIVAAFSHLFKGSYPPEYFKVKTKSFNDINYPYGITQGTSEAAPIVAGTIALMLQINPNLTIEQARQIIQSTAINPGMATPNNIWGAGILNSEQAVKAVSKMK